MRRIVSSALLLAAAACCLLVAAPQGAGASAFGCETIRGCDTDSAYADRCVGRTSDGLFIKLCPKYFGFEQRDRFGFDGSDAGCLNLRLMRAVQGFKNGTIRREIFEYGHPRAADALGSAFASTTRVSVFPTNASEPGNVFGVVGRNMGNVTYSRRTYYMRYVSPFLYINLYIIKKGGEVQLGPNQVVTLTKGQILVETEFSPTSTVDLAADTYNEFFFEVRKMGASPQDLSLAAADNTFSGAWKVYTQLANFTSTSSDAGNWVSGGVGVARKTITAYDASTGADYTLPTAAFRVDGPVVNGNTARFYSVITL